MSYNIPNRRISSLLMVEKLQKLPWGLFYQEKPSQMTVEQHIFVRYKSWRILCPSSNLNLAKIKFLYYMHTYFNILAKLKPLQKWKNTQNLIFAKLCCLTVILFRQFHKSYNVFLICKYFIWCSVQDPVV